MPIMNTTSDLIVESNAQSFNQDVIQKSYEKLVLVDFWAAWCAPCRALTPILERLLPQYSGSVCLVKINTDEQQELAANHGIRSLPTVMLFRDGQAVDQFMGVQPEPVIKRFIDKYVKRESDKQLEQALTLFDSGDTASAISLLQQAIADDPTNDRPKFMLVEWLLDDQRYEEAKATLDSISREGKDEAKYRSLAARLEFALNADSDVNPDELLASIEEDAGNLEARFQLANQLAQGQHLTEALDQLIEIIKRDKNFRDDAPRQNILKIFDLMGGQGELVSQYRSLLARALN